MFLLINQILPDSCLAPCAPKLVSDLELISGFRMNVLEDNDIFRSTVDQ